MKDFRGHWHEEVVLRPYRKASTRLLQLWRIEKFMAKQNEFNHAELVKAESEELSIRERNCAQAQADRDYHQDLEELTDKHQKEMNLLIETRQHWREVMLARQQLEKDVLKRAHNAVEIRQSEPCRTKEAFQATKSRPVSKTKKYTVGPEISYEFITVLPFPISPTERASGRTSVQDSGRANPEPEEEKQPGN
jgi:hypothetical protein